MPLYFVARIKKESTDLSVSPGSPISFAFGYSNKEGLLHALGTWITSLTVSGEYKPIAAVIYAPEEMRSIIDTLWLVHDIIPRFFVTRTDDARQPSIDSEVESLARSFDENMMIPVGVLPHNEVIVQEMNTLDPYRRLTTDRDLSLLFHFASKMDGKTVVFISSSWQGGGVALMRHALIRLLRLVGVDVHWYTLKPSPVAFEVTKNKFHNVLQAVADPQTRLTGKDRDEYEVWIRENSEILKNNYKNASVIIIDDPQPSGLIPYIRKTNSRAKIIFRSHIQIQASLTQIPGTPQYETWQYLWQFIRQVDLYVSHPVPAFVPADVPDEKVVYMPATTDPLDGLNKPLTPGQVAYYRTWFDRIILETGQTPLLPDRPYIIQIARFDPAKGIPDVLKAYKRLVYRLSESGHEPVQLVICGHGAVDDPGSSELYKETLRSIREEYAEVAPDIKVALIPPSDQMLNVLLRGATVALQLSHKEGFEVKITEALMKSVPVVAYSTGGIPLQINDGHGGFLVKAGDTNAVADRVFELLTDESLLSRMKNDASKAFKPEVSTVANAINWLYLCDKICTSEGLSGHTKEVRNRVEDTVTFIAG